MHNFSFDSRLAPTSCFGRQPAPLQRPIGQTALYTKAPQGFSAYPSVLRDWLINDLDSSAQPWKIVVFHQPAFPPGNGHGAQFADAAPSQVSRGLAA